MPGRRVVIATEATAAVKKRKMKRHKNKTNHTETENSNKEYARDRKVINEHARMEYRRRNPNENSSWIQEQAGHFGFGTWTVERHIPWYIISKRES